QAGALGHVVPIGDPGISQRARGIEFNALSVRFEIADAGALELVGWIGRLEAPLAADPGDPFRRARVYRRRCSTTAFAGWHRLGRGTRLLWGSDLDFADDSVEIGSNGCRCHVGLLFQWALAEGIGGSVRAGIYFRSETSSRKARCTRLSSESS